MRALGKDTIIVKNAALIVDGHNNQVPDWTNVTSTTVSGCYVEDAGTSENLVNRDQVLVAWRVFAPPNTVVLPTSRVSWQGVDYDVHGNPAQHNAYSPGMNYITLELVKFTG